MKITYKLKILPISGRLVILLTSLFFTTLIQAQQLRFAFLTDLHVSPGSENEDALIKAVEDINTQAFDFVVVTGDLTNTGSNAELLCVKAALDKLTTPLYIIPGNHETNWSESAGLLFNQLWGNDRFIFRKNGFLLVGYNTGPFMKMGDGHVKQEDIQWLKRILAENQNDRLISFSHYPIADGLDNWTDVSRLLENNQCLVSFCGHGHKLSLLNFGNFPGVMGRALKDKKGFGYNMVEIINNKVTVSEKLSGGTHQPETLAFDLSSSETLKGLLVSPEPDYSVNKNTKTQVKFNFEDTVSIFAGPCIAGDTLVIYGNSAGWVKALRIKDKTIAWQNRFTGAIYSTPVVTSGKVVFGTADGFIRALNLSSGREEWVVNTGSPVLAEGLTEKNFVYIGGGNKGFYKIDVPSGNVIWNFTGINGTIQGKPAISGKNIVFGAWDTHLYCLDKNTGKLNWKWNNGKNQQLFSPGNIVPVISKKKVFIVAPDRYFTSLDLGTGKEIWRSNKYKVRESMGISTSGKYVFAKLMNDSVICIPASSGKFSLAWAVNAGTGYDHNPCPVASYGQTAAIASKSGLVVAIDERSQSILWKYKVGNSSVNKLIFSGNGTLWLSATNGRIISLENKP